MWPRAAGAFIIDSIPLFRLPQIYGNRDGMLLVARAFRVFMGEFIGERREDGKKVSGYRYQGENVQAVVLWC